MGFVRVMAEAGSSASRVEEIGEARRAVDERLHAHDPVVAVIRRRLVERVKLLPCCVS